MIKDEFDVLRLTVELTARGRRINAKTPAQALYVANDGQSFNDGVWQIVLRTANGSNGHSEYMINITYLGRNKSKKGRNITVQTRHFDTGNLELTYAHYVDDAGREYGGGIEVQCEEYHQRLAEDFGIRDGYVYDTPNQVWDGYGEWQVLSNGTVTCYYAGRVVTNPSLDEMKLIGNALDKYVVSGASWTVVRHTTTRKNYPKMTVRLYTELTDMDVLRGRMEWYLKNNELSRFDDYGELD